jgi:transposase
MFYSPPRDIRVSIDVGCKHHQVAVGLSDGQILDEFSISHQPDGFATFFTRLSELERKFQSPIRVAMEGYNGYARPLDGMILARGWQLYNINNLKLARFKEIFPGAAKTDLVDARKGLELFLLQEHLPIAKDVLQVVAQPPRENQILKRLSRRRKWLVNERVRFLNLIQSNLQAVCPSLLAITLDVGSLWFLNLLTCTDDLTKLARMRPKTVQKISAVGDKYARLILAWQKQADFSPEVEWVGEMIQQDARRILELRRQIKDLEVKMTALIPLSSIARLIESIPGFGPISTAELAGEIGNHSRFNAEPSLALYLGMAPLSRESGQFKGSKTPRQVNRRAKAAMMVAVDRHRKQVATSQTYYEKKRAEGKTHNQAIRALGRQLCRVIYRMLKKEKLFTPPK